MGKKKKMTVMDCKERKTAVMAEKLKGRIKELEAQAEVDLEVFEWLEEWFAYCRKSLLELVGRIAAYDGGIEALEAQLEAYEKEGVDSDGQRN